MITRIFSLVTCTSALVPSATEIFKSGASKVPNRLNLIDDVYFLNASRVKRVAVEQTTSANTPQRTSAIEDVEPLSETVEFIYNSESINIRSGSPNWAVWMKNEIGQDLKSKGALVGINVRVFTRQSNSVAVDLMILGYAFNSLVNFAAFETDAHLMRYCSTLRSRWEVISGPVIGPLEKVAWSRIVIGVATGRDIMNAVRNLCPEKDRKRVTQGTFFQFFVDLMDMRELLGWRHTWFREKPDSPEDLGYIITYQAMDTEHLSHAGRAKPKQNS